MAASPSVIVPDPLSLDDAGRPIIPVDGLPVYDKDYNGKFAHHSHLWLYKFSNKLQDNGNRKAYDDNDPVDIQTRREEGLALRAKLTALGKLELQKAISAKLIDHSLFTSDEQELKNFDQLYEIMIGKNAMKQYNHDMIGFLLNLHKIVIHTSKEST